MSETNKAKNGIDFIIPMLRASPQAIKHPQKEPILLGISVRVTRRGMDNRDLIRRKNTLAKGMFEVILTKQASFLNDHNDKETRDSLQRTGANLLDLDQRQSLWFLPRTEMHDLAQWGSKFSSCLIVRMHMVGIVCQENLIGKSLLNNVL
jgi:hypothetical protein